MKQNYALIDQEIDKKFLSLKLEQSEMVAEKLKLSWSNWGFGSEPLEESLERLSRNRIPYIELHGNHYGKDLGYRINDIKPMLKNAGIKVSGVCGMFSRESDLSSVSPFHRQAAIDYIKREVEFTAELGGSYLLVVPAAVGRPVPYDAMELSRSIETLRIIAEVFLEYGVKGAVEPIRSEETTIVHTIAQASEYIEKLGCAGISHINGDVFHMQAGEAHISQAIIEAGPQLVNLHMADSHRGALGAGSMDLDRIIEALYLINYNNRDCFVTPEPLGPGGDPYPAMYGNPDKSNLDMLVEQSIRYFRSRENLLRK